MKLRDCLECGWICGLDDVGEAINNIFLHAQNLFCYEDINTEETELLIEIQKFEVSDNDKIKNVLWNLFQIKTDDIDKEVENKLRVAMDKAQERIKEKEK